MSHPLALVALRVVSVPHPWLPVTLVVSVTPSGTSALWVWSRAGAPLCRAHLGRA